MHTAIAHTAILITRAATLRDDLSAICATSRSLIARGRERRFTAFYARLRPICGGSDAALVTATIQNARLCLDCIARKTGVPLEQINGLLIAIGRTVRLTIGPHRCDACLQRKTTFSLTKDRQP